LMLITFWINRRCFPTVLPTFVRKKAAEGFARVVSTQAFGSSLGA
jgi:hypothetical protein